MVAAHSLGLPVGLGAAAREMQDGLNSAREFTRGTNQTREGHSSALLLQPWRNALEKPQRLVPDHPFRTDPEIPDTGGGLRGCLTLKLCWSCPARKLRCEGIKCAFVVQALGDLQLWTG